MIQRGILLKSIPLLSITVKLLSYYDAGKRLRISNLLKSWKPDIVCLQETKIEHISIGIVQGLWGGPFTGWLILPAIELQEVFSYCGTNAQ